MENRKKLGANYLGANKTEFLVFAPQTEQVGLHFTYPQESQFCLIPQKRGYHHAIIENIRPGFRYLFNLDGQEYPDPASNYQPEGVFGPSEVIDHYQWNAKEKNWHGVPLARYIIYELHVGTYTKEGTFSAIIPTLDELCQLGITAIELMPIAQFCGNRNWGYDGVFPFAPQNNYGTCEDFKRLVESCHKRGLAVILDVIYSHFGPEGNILGNFGPYLTDRYRTPWGSAINFDGPHSDAVRYFFLENALMWVRDYHIDALRLDALHTLFDYSPYHFLAELSDHVHRFGHRAKRHVFLMAECSLNDTKIIRPHQTGGYAIDSQWNDDFHHAVHTYITGENNSYYQDFGELSHIVKAYVEGYVLTGQYSEYWQCRHGHSSEGIPAEKFIVFLQNHDHIGNRPHGERLNHLVEFDQVKIAAVLMLWSPFIPLLFMGEEYAETAPFLYFTNYSNSTLTHEVWQGRKYEMITNYNHSKTPNPQEESSFIRSKINSSLRHQGIHAALYRFYQYLIKLRKTIPALSQLDKKSLKTHVGPKKKLLFLHRWHHHSQVFFIINFDKTAHLAEIPLSDGDWQKILDSDEPQWNGLGNNPLPSKIKINSYEKTKIKLEPYSVAAYSNGCDS